MVDHSSTPHADKKPWRFRKILLSCCITVSIVLLLGLIVASVLIHSKGAAQQLSKELSRRLGAEVKIEQIALSFFGLLHATLSNIAFTLDNRTQLTAKAITVFIHPWKLFRGARLPLSVTVEKPVVALFLHEQKQHARQKAAPEENQSAALKKLAEAGNRLSGLSVSIHQGQLIASYADYAPVKLSNLKADLVVAPERLTLQLACSSDFWEAATLQASYEVKAPSPDQQGLLHVQGRLDQLNSEACKKLAAGTPFQTAAVSSALDRVLSTAKPTLVAEAFIPMPLPQQWQQQLQITASGEGIGISVPEVGCEVNEVSAALTMDHGKLFFSNVQARISSTFVRNGQARCDLTGGFALEAVCAEFESEVGDLRRFFQYVPQASVRSELDRFSALAGRVSGSFSLERRASGYVPSLSIDRLNIEAAYRNFPQPFGITGGMVRFCDGHLELDNCTIQVGRSKLERIAAHISFREGGTFECTIGNSSLFVEDVAGVLAGFDAQHVLSRIDPESGSVLIKHGAIKGPLLQPREWDLALNAQIKKIKLLFPTSTEPVLVQHATVLLDDTQARISGVRATLLDAQITGAAVLDDYRQGVQHASFSVTGTVGDNAVQHIFSSQHLPQHYRVRAPVVLKNLHGRWARGSGITMTGTVRCGKATEISWDVQTGTGSFLLQNAQVSDSDSHCSFRFGLTSDVFDIAWKGSLRKETLDRILVDNRILSGEVHGDFTALFDEQQPRRSSATGSLYLQDIELPIQARVPCALSAASFSAQGSYVQVTATKVRFGSNHADIRGSVMMNEQGFALDGDIFSQRLDLAAFTAPASQAEHSAQGNSSAAELWDTPLRGSVRLHVGELVRGSLCFAPFEVNTFFAEKNITLVAGNVKLCGITIPARVSLTPDGIDLDAQLQATNASVTHIAQCLSGEPSPLTGKLDVQVQVAARAPLENIRAGLQGHVAIMLRKGRIYKSNLLMDLLSFLSVRNLLSLKKFDIGKKGFPYHQFVVKGDIQRETFLLREALFDSDAVTVVGQGTVSLADGSLDISCLAMPFQVLDVVLVKIPMLGSLVGKTPIGVPVRITGTVKEAKLKPGSPTTIIKSVAGMAERMLKLPLQIIEPVIDHVNGINRP